MNSILKRINQFSRTHSALARGNYPFFKRFGSFTHSASPVEIELDGRNVLMFGSNDYLGLANHPLVKEAAIKAIAAYGTGVSGSRLLNGNRDITEELEARLADFFGYEAALVFTTGFQTNLGAVSALCGPDDVIIADHCIHASAWEGMLSSTAKRCKFPHNDVTALQQLLERHQNALVIVEGVYSIDGNLGDLPAITRLANQHQALLYVDDAHGIGVLGQHGRGTCEHFGLTDGVDVLAGTFSKAFGSVGGFLAANHNIIDYIKHVSRAFIFSASLPAAATAATLTALEIIRSEPERRARLRQMSDTLRSELLARNYPVVSGITPVVGIKLPDEESVNHLVAGLLKDGIYVNAIWQPAAPTPMIRIHLMSEHSESQLEKLVAALDRHWPDTSADLPDALPIAATAS